MVILHVLLSFFLIFQLALPAFAAPEAGASEPAQVQTYAQLVQAIRQAQAASQKRTDEAVAQEKVREAWEIGKLIDEHILLHKERAAYGQQVLKRLSADLGISHTELKYMLQFARAYPIGPAPDQLSWAHIRELLAVNEPKKRKELSKQAVSGKWSQKELRREIKRRKSAKEISVSKAPLEAPLVPIKGKLDTYRIVITTAGPWKGKPVLDLGFSNYLSLGTAAFKEGDILSVVGARLPAGEAGSPRPLTQGGETPPLRLLKDATPADLFTYRAYVINVTDGDTLWVLVDLGFGFVTQQHLRLRGIDAPEIESAEGREAKRFLEKRLQKGPLVIRTVKSDKYDRFLADLFVEDQYLNQELVSHGLAVVVES